MRKTADNKKWKIIYFHWSFYMIKTKKLLAILFSSIILFSSSLYASSFFSGYTGAKLNYSGNKQSEKYNPDLKLQAFFAGQFNYSENIWSHIELSIDTGDFLNESLFHETESLFQIDELSLIFRANLGNFSDYFSIYMGTYEPIGSDVFLRRYFSINPIASKLVDSYLGLSGSIIYPQFGLGISNIIKMNTTPAAFGTYLYVNHEDEKFYVLNADLRGACNFRFFTCDLAAGLGFPLANNYQGSDVLVAVDKAYWHAGTTILIGNDYTQALFLQAGINNASFKLGGEVKLLPSDFYLLFEPRFIAQTTHINISIFSLPPKTIEKLIFVDDTLGADLHIYTQDIMLGKSHFTLGSHFSFSLINKTFLDFGDITNILSNGFNINITPYISTQLFSGELHIQSVLKIMDFVKGNIGNGISVDVGYRTSF